MRRFLSSVLPVLFCLPLFAATGHAKEGVMKITVLDALAGRDVETETVVKSKEEWRKTLSPEAFHVLREKGTERPFTGKFDAFKGDGIFTCAGCGNHLFDSRAKYDSRTGWPSFYQPVDKRNIATEDDRSWLGTLRIEVLCARCGGHLGHVFEDGPPPTGLRYCMNSVSLDFIPRK